MKFYIGDWAIPKDTKNIVIIEAIEEYDTVTVCYTSDRCAYPIENLRTLNEVYLKETANT